MNRNIESTAFDAEDENTPESPVESTPTMGDILRMRTEAMRKIGTSMNEMTDKAEANAEVAQLIRERIAQNIDAIRSGDKQPWQAGVDIVRPLMQNARNMSENDLGNSLIFKREFGDLSEDLKLAARENIENEADIINDAVRLASDESEAAA